MQGDKEVTEGQRSVLFALFTDGAQTLGALSEHERVTPPSMNRTINALVTAGLVTRETAVDDARKVRLDLSAAGRTFIIETRARRDAWFTQALAEISQEDRATIDAAGPILRRLSDL